METRAKYAAIGFFTLLVIAAGFVFVYWLKRLDETGIRQTMYLEFPGTVSGLEPGGSVYFNGLKVGQVVGLSFDPADPNKIVVTASVRADTPIKTDTFAKVGASILTGVAYIEMSGGSTGAQSVFEVTPPLVVGQAGGDMMVALNQAAGDINKLVSRVDRILDANEARINETVESVRTFTSALSKNSAGVEDFMKSVSDVSKSIQSLSGRLTGLVDNADKIVAAIDPEKIKSTVDNASRVIASVADASDDVVANFRQATADIAQFTGGLGTTLARVDTVVAALDAERIAAAIDNVSSFTDRLVLAGPDIDRIVADIGNTAANVSGVTDRINARSGDIDQIITAAKELTTQLNQSSKRLDSLFGKAEDMLTVEGGKNFFQEASEAARSLKQLADSLNGRVDEIADSIAKFSTRGLGNVDALVSDLRNTAARIDRVFGNLERNPSSLIFGGNSGIREYNRR